MHLSLPDPSPWRARLTLATLMAVMPLHWLISVRDASFVVLRNELIFVGTWSALLLALLLHMPASLGALAGPPATWPRRLRAWLCQPWVGLFGVLGVSAGVQALLGHAQPYGVLNLTYVWYCVLAVVTAGVAQRLRRQPEPERLSLLGLGALLWAVACGVQALIGWIQYLELYTHPWFLRWVEPLHVAGRAVGNIRQPNMYGMAAVTGAMGAAISLTIRPRWLTRRLAGVLWFLLVLNASGAVLSASRSALLSAVLTSLLVLGLMGRQATWRTRAPWLAIVGISVLMRALAHALDALDILPFWGAYRGFNLGFEGNQDRWRIWTAVAGLAWDHAGWWGQGLGLMAYGLFLSDRALFLQVHAESAHNGLLQIWVDHGPVVLALVVLSLAAAAVRVCKVRSPEVLAVAAVVLVGALHHLLEYPLEYSFFLLPWAFCLGYVSGPPPALPDPTALPEFADRPTQSDLPGGASGVARAATSLPRGPSLVLVVSMLVCVLAWLDMRHVSHAEHRDTSVLKRIGESVQGYETLFYVHRIDYAVLWDASPAINPDAYWRLANRVMMYRQNALTVRAYLIAGLAAKKTCEPLHVAAMVRRVDAKLATELADWVTKAAPQRTDWLDVLNQRYDFDTLKRRYPGCARQFDSVRLQ